MSSISIKSVRLIKSFGVMIRLAPLALPALVMPLSALRWHPAFNAGEFPGAAFHPETVIAYSVDGRGEAPEITAVPDGPRPGLPADTAPPEEIARAFYRAVRENAEDVRGSGPPFSVENAGSPDDISGPAVEPDGGTGVKTGRAEGEEWRLLGFIRDSAGIERRYFKEIESGKIVTVTDMPESFPANTKPAEGDNR
ncbi:MAG: hypothetical protein LBP80_09360 [Treponema sp.]|jgi:hypothetical protein|nr:hypothetical protein [Treponema sp.]